MLIMKLSSKKNKKKIEFRNQKSKSQFSLLVILFVTFFMFVPGIFSQGSFSDFVLQKKLENFELKKSEINKMIPIKSLFYGQENSVPSATSRKLNEEKNIGIKNIFAKIQTLEGTFSIVSVDDLKAESKDQYMLAVMNEKGQKNYYRLVFSEPIPQLPESGSSISVTGSVKNNTINVENNSLKVTSSQYSTKEVGDSTAAVVMFTFDSSSGIVPPSNFTVDTVSSQVFSDQDSVKNFFLEGSHTLSDLSGTVLGVFEINSDTSSCNYPEWTTEVNSMIPAGTLDEFENVIYVFPRVPSCGGIIGLAGYRTAWINGFDFRFRQVAAHELGHVYGLGHAKGIYCPDVAIDVYANCQEREYGNPFDTMGPANPYGHPFHFSKKFQQSLDWTSFEEHQVVTTTGNYLLAPHELDPSSTTTTQSLVIPKTDTREFYFIEYRQHLGTFDSLLPSSATQGALILISGNNSSETKLVDTHFNTYGDFSDAALADGYDFYDPINDILIRQISHSSEGVVLSVEFLQDDLTNGQAAQFFNFGDFGDSGLIEVLDTGGLTQVGDNLTIEAWFKPQYSGSNQVKLPIVSKYSNTRDELIYSLDYGMWENSAGGPYLQFVFDTNSGLHGFAATSTSLSWNSSEWIHVAVTKQGSEYRLFINGVQKGYYYLFPSLGNILDDTNATYTIGNYPFQDQVRVPLQGMIDDLRVSNSIRDVSSSWNTQMYNEALSVDNNTNLMLRFDRTPLDIGVHRLPSSSNGLIMYPEGRVTLPDLQPVTDLELLIVDNQIELNWSDTDGALRYNIYRSADPYFTPDAQTLLTSVMTNSYTEQSSGFVGNPDANVFYVVRAVGSIGESENSATVGEFDKLIHPALNLASLPLAPFSSPAILLADQLHAGGTEETADRLGMLDNTTQQGDFIWFWLNESREWVSSQTGEVEEIELTPGIGFWIENKQSNTQTLTLTGKVPERDSQDQLIRPGIQLIGSVYPSELSLYQASFIEDGAFGSNSELYADRVWYWDSTIQDYDYAWLIDDVSPEYNGKWWDGQPVFQESLIHLRPGFGYVYQRRASEGFNWTNPG